MRRCGSSTIWPARPAMRPNTCATAPRSWLASCAHRGAGALTAPASVIDSSDWTVPPWVHALVPIRFSRGDAAYVLLGPRDGGRRYLSEDLGVLARLGAAVAEHVEQLRSLQMQNLVS